MRIRKLVQSLLLLNLTCFFVGLYAYFVAFSRAETVDLIMWSVFACAGSFAGAVWVTRQHGGVVPANSDGEEIDQNSVGVNALLFMPLALLCFEVFALFQLNAAQNQVSWINIAFACHLGQNLEALSRRG
ncbi:hypothetical protein H3H37_09645 [Duganella sp. LX20W]|uniref:Uncharacterized protein n=1 Tax=Rugamonas brunnea TaxID=2758569 RepID=A0A7W2ERH9_9BURK|nr:hypothetical protein [Rugamonas brunnea]MBA5637315.1 hypothetical protein [Rugamonas brunnea]